MAWAAVILLVLALIGAGIWFVASFRFVDTRRAYLAQVQSSTHFIVKTLHSRREVLRAYQPAWAKLHHDGELVSLNIYERALPARSAGWNYLLVFRVGESPHQYLEKERAVLAEMQLAELPGVHRVEILQATPNAWSPFPGSGGVDIGRLAFTAEYIEVKADRLDEYRDTMFQTSGPAMQQLIADGFVYNFMAMETCEVIFQASSDTPWNQIHLIGIKPFNLLRFIPNYGKVLEQRGTTFDTLTDHLGSITRYYKTDLVREVCPLRLPAQ